MAEHSDIVDRADALMRRRSSFVAAQAKRAVAANEDDDLPVLTEVIPAEPAIRSIEPTEAAQPIEAIEVLELPELFADTVMPPLEVAAAIAKRSEAELEEERTALFAAEIAEAISRQMHFELPTLIEAALVKAGDELRAGITSTISDAVREFIVQRKHGSQDGPQK